MGSGGEGTQALTTVLDDGDLIQWSVAPVQPDGVVTIAKFAGTAVTNQNIEPFYNPQTEVWSAQFHSKAAKETDSIQYNAYLDFEGDQLPFDPYLKWKKR